MTMARETFQQLIRGERPVLVDFYADWCGPCKAMAPVMRQLADAWGNQLKIVKVDVDRNAAVAQQYQVRGVPTFVLFKNGRTVWRHTGAASLRDFNRQLTPHLREQV